MTDNNPHTTVRLPGDRWGTVVKVRERQDGSPPVVDVETDEGEIVTFVEIAEGRLIPREDYNRLIAVTRGIKDGTIATIDVPDWTD